MTIWLQENWIIILIGALVLLALLFWLWSRRISSPGATLPDIAQAPRPPIAPVKPDIVAAEPARFAPPDPAQAKVAVAPAPAPEPVPAPTATSALPDNLALLKGVGPKLVALLGTLGVHRFDQIAAWSDDDINAIDPQLGNFQGRIRRDNWVDQAAYLARGDKAGFEAKYGALGGEL